MLNITPQGTIIGDLISGGTANDVLFVDSNGNLGQSSNLTFFTEAGFSVQKITGFANLLGFSAGAQAAFISNPPYSFVVDNAQTNLVVNPSFEVNTSNWSATGANASISRVTSKANTGSASCRVAIIPAAANQGITSATIAVAANTVYVFSCFLQGNSGGESVYLQINGNNSGATNGLGQTLTTGWKRYSISKTTNASDTTITVSVLTNGVVAPTFFFDSVQVETNSSGLPSTYFDGSITGGVTNLGYAWTGTANASTSTRSAGFHTIAALNSNVNASFAFNVDGSLGAYHMVFQPEGGQYGDGLFIYDFIIDKPTAIVSLGTNEAGVRINNTNNGCAAWIQSAATTEVAMVVEATNLTSGTVLGLSIPTDTTNVTGEFLSFVSKATGKSKHKFNKNRYQIGDTLEANVKSFNCYSGGNYALTTTSKSGTVAWSSTTVTGSSTSFTTDFVVGDIIVVSGQSSIIQAIASNTSLTTLTAANPAISAGTAYAKQNTQYNPFTMYMEGPKGDHQVGGYADLIYAKFFNGSSNPKFLIPVFTAGSGTLTATSGTSSFTTSSANAALVPGAVITPTGHSPIVVDSQVSTTSFKTRTNFNSSLSAVAFSYQLPGFTSPTSDTSGEHYQTTPYRENISAGPVNSSSNTTIFSTAPTIRANRLETDRTAVLTATGTLHGSSATKTITLQVKLAGNSVLTSSAETIAPTNTCAFVWRVYITNLAATNSQQIISEFWTKSSSSNSTVISRIDQNTSSKDSTQDMALDMLVNWSDNTSTFAAQSKILEYK